MGRSRFLSILLLSLLLPLFFSNGFGRKMATMEAAVDRRRDSTVEVKENAGNSRRMMMMEIMDYSDPEPNTNTRGGYVAPPPPNHG